MPTSSTTSVGPRGEGTAGTARHVRRGRAAGAGGATLVPFTGLVRGEALKLRRSPVWLFVAAMPLLTVITGTVNFQANQDQLTAGWEGYLSQVTLFYGLFYLAIGTALIATVAWRPEHRDASWNAMRTIPAPPARVVLAKTTVMLAPLAVMQAVLVVLAWIAGAAVLELPGLPPTTLALTGALTIVAAVPVLGVQSLLAMVLPSFGGPVALGLVGAVIGVGVSMASPGLAVVWPYSLLTTAQVLGSTAISTAGALEWREVGRVLVAAVATGAVSWALLALVSREVSKRG